jgi:hypothetical protein
LTHLDLSGNDVKKKDIEELSNTINNFYF